MKITRQFGPFWSSLESQRSTFLQSCRSFFKDYHDLRPLMIKLLKILILLLPLLIGGGQIHAAGQSAKTKTSAQNLKKKPKSKNKRKSKKKIHKRAKKKSKALKKPSSTRTKKILRSSAKKKPRKKVKRKIRKKRNSLRKSPSNKASRRAARNPRKIKRDNFFDRNWPWIGAVGVITFAILAFMAYLKNQRDQMRFNFVESDINRGPHSQAQAALKSQPVTNIYKSPVSEVSQVFSNRKTYTPPTVSPFAHIPCELNFNNPVEDHGKPRERWNEKSA